MKKLAYLFSILSVLIFSGCMFDATPTEITITPGGLQRVLENSSITYSAKTFNKFGYDLSENSSVKFSAKCGTFKGNEYFPAEDSPEEDIITATCGDAIATAKVKILPENYMQLPFEYNGKVYKGICEESGDFVPEKDFAEITYPTRTNLVVDGFFTLEGTEHADATFKNGYYLLVEIQKDGSSNKGLKYYLRGDFSTRIWLRDGAGDYTVYIYPINTPNHNQGIDGVEGDGFVYEGDIEFCQYTTNLYYSQTICFNVKNIREEKGSWIYPSDYIQSDDILIMNMAEDLTANAKDLKEAAIAINKYVASTYPYDNDSFPAENSRKKQDAVSVVKYKTAICAGYSYLTAALFRYKGIPTKSIYGRMKTDDENTYHAWNNFTLDNGISWLFLEPQVVTTNFQEVSYDGKSYEYLHVYGFTAMDGAIWNRTADDEEIIFTETGDTGY